MIIPKTYNKTKRLDPRWWMLIAFIIFVLIINWTNCSGQWFEISHRSDACENYESAVVTANYPAQVYSMSLVMFYDSLNWQLVSVCRSDVFIDGFLIDSVHPNKWKFSWYSLHPLPMQDTLFSFVFMRKSYLGGGDLEWSVAPGECEITDFNATPYQCVFIDGWLRCLSSGINPFKTDIEIPVKQYNSRMRQIIIFYRQQVYGIDGRFYNTKKCQ
jgi:hypothetical protein